MIGRLKCFWYGPNFKATIRYRVICTRCQRPQRKHRGWR